MTKSKAIKQAVILAGGEGRRLRPYSKVLPKPLWPVDDIPIVEILIQQLSRCGIKDIILAVGHQAKLIEMVLGDGSQFKVKLRYVVEKTPLGTAGPLKNIADLDEDFLVLNGDILTDLDFKKFIHAHLQSEVPATIATFKRTVKIDFGVIEEADNKIINYKEKPTLNQMVSGGIYAFNRKVLKQIPKGKFDFPDLVKRLIKEGDNPGIYLFKGHWLDIGRIDDWERADRLFRRKKNLFLKKS